MGEKTIPEGEKHQQVQKLTEEAKMKDTKPADEEKIVKKDDDIIVLKVDMHCEACARKVARSLKGFPGVEDVTADSNDGIVRVKGKEADPAKVCDRVEKKSRRKVQLISPLPPSPPPDDEKKEDKIEMPVAMTVILNIQMHCEACARLIRKRLQKIKGVEFVKTDASNSQVAITGILNPAELVNQVYKRTKKKATIVAPPPPPEESQQKAEEEKKDGENKDTSQEGESADKVDDKKQDDVKRNQIWPTRYYTDHAYHNAYPHPQIFSDENPNACSIM